MNNIPVCNSLKEAIQLTFGRGVCIESRQRIHGGDANDAYLIRLSNGKAAFIKENTISNADSFRAEAEGLSAIKSTNSLRVPMVYALGTNIFSAPQTKSQDHKETGYSFLLMEFIDRRGISKDFWENLGRGLAAMHRADTSSFTGTVSVPQSDTTFVTYPSTKSLSQVDFPVYGFKSNNYIGAGKQQNTTKTGWIEFFSECRLKPQFKLAEKYFDERLIKAANYLVDNLDKYLIEPEKPSLLHGDLWSGNFISDENGQPMLIDPAVYVGCNEADIAMTELFGGFDRRFYEAYYDEMGEIPGYDNRRDLYNLYHLTNHLNIFGYAYLPAVARTITHYAIAKTPERGTHQCSAITL